jgi:hypothetical protein
MSKPFNTIVVQVMSIEYRETKYAMESFSHSFAYF